VSAGGPQAPRPLLAAAAAVPIMASLGTLYAWSVFVEPLEARLGASRAAVSAVFSTAIVAFTVGMLVGPLLHRRLTAPHLVLATGGLAAAGLLMAAAVPSIWAIAFGYGALFGLANGFGYGAALQLVHNGVARRRGLATGLAVASYTLGSALAAPLLGRLIAAGGAGAAFLALAVLLAALNALAAWLTWLSQTPLTAHGVAADPARLRPPRRQFAILWLSFLLMSAVGVMTLGHAAPLAAALGGSGGDMALAVVLTTVGNGAGRLAGGWLGEKLRPRRLLVGAPAVAAAALAAILASGSVAGALAGLFAVGVAYGTIAAALPMLVTRSYGAAQVARVYGRLFTAWGVAGLLSPLVGGLLFDATRSYAGALLGAVALALAAVAAGLCHRENSGVSA
jgi:MFS family permease